MYNNNCVGHLREGVMRKIILFAFMAGSIFVDACDRPGVGVYGRNCTTRTASIHSNFLPRQNKGESKVSYVKRVAKFVKDFQKEKLDVRSSGSRTPNAADTSNIKHSLYMSYLRTLYGLYEELDEGEKKDSVLVETLRGLRVMS